LRTQPLTLFNLEEGGRLLKHLLFRGWASARDFILRHQYGIKLEKDRGHRFRSGGCKLGTIQDVVRVTDFDRPVFSTSERQRLRCGIVLIDILPFGPITDEDKRIIGLQNMNHYECGRFRRGL